MPGGRRAGRLAVLGLAVLFAGCGSDVSVLPSATPTGVPLPTPVTTTFAPQAMTWYAGLVIHVDSASAVLRAGIGTVTVGIRIENPGPDPASLDAPIRLTSNGQVVEPVRGTELPDVEAGGSAAATIPFEVEAGFDVGLATFRIGRTSEHQVVVPLVAGAAALVTNAPQALVFKAVTATAGTLRLTLRSGELRADLPDWGLELLPQALALTLTYDAKYVGQFGGGFAFTAANVGLKLPNGTVIAPRTDGHSQSAAVLLPGATSAGLASRFEVPIPGPGAYALVIRDGKASATIPVNVGAPIPGG